MAKKKQKQTINIHSIKECPDCASLNLIYNEERQQIICRDCGLIYEPMAPELEAAFETAHSFKPKREAAEKIMVRIEEEKPKKVKARKPKKKAKKPVKKKPAKKLKRKPVKKFKKRPVKRKVVRKALKKKLKKKGILKKLRAKLKKKKR